MLAFESMIAAAARDAGMKTPPDSALDHDDRPKPGWSPEEYPHFHVFCNAQLARPVEHGEHWDNAKIIAAIPEDKIKTTTFDDLRELGVRGI